MLPKRIVRGAPAIRRRRSSLGPRGLDPVKRLLRGVIGRLVDDRGVRLRRVVLREFPAVSDQLLVDMVIHVPLLQQRVPGVLFVADQVAHVRRGPCPLKQTAVAVPVQPPRDGKQRVPAYDQRVDLPDDLRLFRIDLNAVPADDSPRPTIRVLWDSFDTAASGAQESVDWVLLYYVGTVVLNMNE